MEQKREGVRAFVEGLLTLTFMLFAWEGRLNFCTPQVKPSDQVTLALLEACVL
jgi:hypothetical protein